MIPVPICTALPSSKALPVLFVSLPAVPGGPEEEETQLQQRGPVRGGMGGHRGCCMDQFLISAVNAVHILA